MPDRPRIFKTEEAQTEALLMWVQKYSISEIASYLACDRSSVYNLLFSYGVPNVITQKRKKRSRAERLRIKRAKSLAYYHANKKRDDDVLLSRAYARRFPKPKSYSQYLKEERLRHPPVDLRKVRERMNKEIAERIAKTAQ